MSIFMVTLVLQDFFMENWKIIEQMPELLVLTKVIISPPQKPISEMSCDESREFAIDMTTKLLGHQKCFGDLSKKKQSGGLPKWTG